ncbi:MAG: hypothetical protein HRU19_24510 [Pseudobacteriovorax sp.]|nr:hypothetical protein [Pseudobacteriovorax sp.]
MKTLILAFLWFMTTDVYGLIRVHNCAGGDNIRVVSYNSNDSGNSSPYDEKVVKSGKQRKFGCDTNKCKLSWKPCRTCFVKDGFLKYKKHGGITVYMYASPKGKWTTEEPVEFTNRSRESSFEDGICYSKRD